MSISFLSVFSNVSVCSAHLIISFHPSSDLLTTTTSRDRLFSPLVANQTVVHLRRRSILCNFPLTDDNFCSCKLSFAVVKGELCSYSCNFVSVRMLKVEVKG